MVPSVAGRAALAVWAVAVVALAVAVPPVSAMAYSVGTTTIGLSPDGYAQVTTVVSFNATEGAIVITPYAAPDAYSIVAIDGNKSAVPFSLNGTSIVLNVLVRTSPVTLTYSTALLTSKNGPFWNLNVTLPTTADLILPVNATLVTISSLPSDISSVNGQVHLTLGNGTWSLVYFIPPPGSGSKTPASGGLGTGWLYLAAGGAVIAAVAFLLIARRRKKPTVLRPDDEKILAYVRSRGGKAYASDIVNTLGMPKSTVWKALRRLESSGLIKMRKDGNRVIVEG